MDAFQQSYLGILKDLGDIKREGFISEEEYAYYKSEAKDWLTQIIKKKEKLEYVDYSSLKGELSEDEIYDLLESFAPYNEELGEYEDYDEVKIKEKINALSKIDLHHLFDVYNFGNGTLIPEIILQHKDCDLAFALEIFDWADGFSFLEKYYVQHIQPTAYNADWWNLCKKIFEDIGNNKYPIVDHYTGLPYATSILLAKSGVSHPLIKEVEKIVASFKK